MYSYLFSFLPNFWTMWRIKYCRLGDVEFVVCRDDTGNVQAFYNVCRHHASILASGSGQKSCFVCPYHVSLITTLSMRLSNILILFFYEDPSFLCYGPCCEVEDTNVKLSFMIMAVTMIWSFLVLGFYLHYLFSCFGNFDAKWLLFLQGWTYGLNGALLKAKRISGMRDFNVNVSHSIL